MLILVSNNPGSSAFAVPFPSPFSERGHVFSALACEEFFDVVDGGVLRSHANGAIALVDQNVAAVVNGARVIAAHLFKRVPLPLCHATKPVFPDLIFYHSPSTLF